MRQPSLNSITYAFSIAKNLTDSTIIIYNNIIYNNGPTASPT